MRFVAALAALAALFSAAPASAQKEQPKPEPFRADAVAADRTSDPASTVPNDDPENVWVLDLSSGGRVLVRLRPDVAPKHVERIKTLTRSHFYDGIKFHRVIDEPESMAQGGDPKGDGTGGSDLPDLPSEFSTLPHVRGTVSAARTRDPNSANSQFFIMLGPKLAFDQNYTVFGRVISGMQWVDKIARGEPPANPTRIIHAYIAADNPPPYAPEAPKTVLPPGEKEITLPPGPSGS
ncbi:peptidylprolyl isomerase [Sphingomonas canadensis]|uniref:Peptidyl-prolyl cis-trans isomerase n=1 Tax=Sphingomonas canadensis TaxID=1219257 RepID=A0ABW3H6M7_9SPHN|nr:peptidylprolyl isomerase [Sphingomonas canadensis]MCW3836407.1 peptidylprolyl isomerase [Sphingomonas canadensis]